MYQSPTQASAPFSAPMGSLEAAFEPDESMINEAFPAGEFYESYAHGSLPGNAMPLSVPSSSEFSQQSFGSFTSHNQPLFAVPHANFQNDLSGLSFTSSATEADDDGNIGSLASQLVQHVPQHREASEEWSDYLEFN
jgi:hypothetical protein